jgi:hypothetical protein
LSPPPAASSYLSGANATQLNIGFGPSLTRAPRTGVSLPVAVSQSRTMQPHQGLERCVVVPGEELVKQLAVGQVGVVGRRDAGRLSGVHVEDSGSGVGGALSRYWMLRGGRAR